MSNNKDDNRIDNSFIEDIQDYLTRLKKSKEKMDKYDILKFLYKVNEIKKNYEDAKLFNNNYKWYIDEITDKINRRQEINKTLEENIEIYRNEFDKLNNLLKGEINELNSDALLTEEEIRTIREDYLERKISISTAIIKIKDKIESIRKEIAELETQIDKEENEFEYTSSIGISKEQYDEIMRKLRSKEVIDEILSEKGVLDIATRKINERTAEEKEKLASVRNAIRDEVAKAVAKKNESVLDIIQFLYNTDKEVKKEEEPSKVSISSDDLKNITININTNPLKVSGTDKKNYKPQPAPKDMIHVQTNNKEIIKNNKIDSIPAMFNSEERNKLDKESWNMNNEDEKVSSMFNSEERKELDREDWNMTSEDEKVSSMFNSEERKELDREDWNMNNEDEKVSSMFNSEERKKLDKEGWNMNNEANVSEIREALEAITKAIDLVKALEGKNIPNNVEVSALAKLYDTKKNELNELIKNQTSIQDKNEQQKTQSNIEKTSGEYRLLSNNYDKLADERIKLIEKDGSDSKALAKIDDKLRDLAIRMKEAQKDKTSFSNISKENKKTHPSPKPTPVPTPQPTPEPNTSEVLESRKGLKDKITIFIDEDSNGKAYIRKAAFDRYFGKYENIETARIDGALCYAISEQERKYLEDNKDNSYSPYDIEYVKVNLEEKTTEDVLNGIEEITLYRDLDDDEQAYATETDLKLFGLTPTGNPIKIYGDPCYKITPEEDGRINTIAAAHEPRIGVKYVDVHLNDYEDDKEEDITLYIARDDNDNIYATERILKMYGITPSGTPIKIYGDPCYKITPEQDLEINQKANAEKPKRDVIYKDVYIKQKDIEYIYRDLDDKNQLYASEKTLNRFGLKPKGTPTTIKGEECYKITKEEDKIINDKAKDNDPKIDVKYVDVHLKVKEENIVIYKAVDDNDQLYTTKDVFDKFGIKVDGDPTDILGKQCYKLSPEQHKIMKDKAKDIKDPIYNFIYKPVLIKKKEVEIPLHYQEIINKATTGLGIKKKDGKRYRAANIKVWQSFKDELHAGNYLYNILHFPVAVVKLGMNLVRKAASKIMLSARGRAVGKEIENRLDGKSENKELNLTEKDLQILWDEYKGRNLRADMNNQINPILLPKLREFGMKKVEKINNEIKQHYLAVIATSDEIEKQQELIAKIPDEKVKEKKEAQEKLKSLYKFAADSIRIIQSKRKEADNLISSGVHGMEEDFKAVETKMNYLGLRFAKERDFDGELQARLSDAGHRINEGIATNNDKELFNAFIDYEKIYYENTEVKGSIVGKRSTGKKWYSPLAEMMDYRDDPFIRDLFTSIATVGAAISIANGILTHCIKDQQFQNQVNNDINAANQSNMQYHNAVQQGVKNIQGQHSAEIEGLQAQVYKDLGYGINTGERGILDKANWDLSSSGYHADDAILHSEMDKLQAATINQLGNMATTGTQGVTAMAQMESNLMTTINNALQPLYQYSKAYAQGHTFAYDAHLVPMEWFAQHPNAFNSLGDALSVINTSADTMALLSPTMMQTIGSLPSDLATTLGGAISSLALVRSSIAKSKGKTNGRNVDHRQDEIGQMFGEKIIGVPEEQEETKKGPSK